MNQSDMFATSLGANGSAIGVYANAIVIDLSGKAASNISFIKFKTNGMLIMIITAAISTVYG